MSLYYMVPATVQGYHFVGAREQETPSHHHEGARIPSIFVNGAQVNPFMTEDGGWIHPYTQAEIEPAYRWTLDNIRNRLLDELVPTRIDWYKKNDPFLPADFMPHAETPSTRRYQDYYPSWLLFNEVYRDVAKRLRLHLAQTLDDDTWDTIDFAALYPADIYNILEGQKFVMMHTSHPVDLHFSDGRTWEIRAVDLRRFPLDSGVVRIASPNGDKHSRMTLTSIGGALFEFRSAPNFLGDPDVEWQVEDDQLEVVVQDGVLEYEIGPSTSVE